MTKAELIDEVTSQATLTRKETELVVNRAPFFKVGKRLRELVNT